MSLRTRIFILISLTVLIILGISLLLVWGFRKKAPATTAINQNLPTAQQTTSISSGGAIEPIVNAPAPALPINLTSEDVEKNTAKQLAKVFIERYGTYSTDNGSENVKEIKSLVTSALWTTLSARMNNIGVNENQAPTGVFYGISTQVFNMELNNWTGSSATIAMQLARTEEKDGIRTVKHQNAEVNMVKQNEKWLAQNFKWL